MHKLSGKGFKILLDILVSAEGKAKYVEIPYTMRIRARGDSKLNAWVAWEFFTLILNKAFGRILPVRFLSFALVGLGGIFVHISVLWFSHKVIHIPFIYSQTVATLIAMTSNFILNNHFTFRDRRLQGVKLFRGLFSFYVACALGALINISLADFLYGKAFTWWLAGVIGVIAGAVWNYALTSTFTWKQDST